MSSAGKTFLDYPVTILSPIILPRTKESIQYDCSMTNFRRLMKLYPTSKIQNISSREVLHSLCGLYDVALPCMDLNTIYASILDCKAVTICVVDKPKCVQNRLIQKLRRKNFKKKKNIVPNYDELIAKKLSDLESNVSDIYSVKTTEPKSKTAFDYVYSDSDSDDERDGLDLVDDETAGSDHEKYTEGYNTFLISSLRRKKLQQEEFIAEKSFNSENIGFEDLLLGATTYEICFVEGKRIIHLTFIAVQKYFRGSGLGSALLNAIKTRDISGEYAAIVVHADPGALEFFKRNDFTDDYVINSQWKSFAAEYTNCTLMTFYPSFSDPDYIMVDKSGEKGFSDMDRLHNSWQKQTESMHVNQAALFHRMRQEIIELRKSVASQDAISKQLMSELRKVTRERDKIKIQLKSDSSKSSDLGQSRDNMKSPRRMKLPAIGESPKEKELQQVGPEGELNDRDFVLEIKSKFDKSVFAMNLSGVEVTRITPSFLSSRSKEIFEKFKRSVPSSTPVRLYYVCQDYLNPKKCCEILANGFSDHDRIEYLQKKGFLFSSLPQISPNKNTKKPTSKLILAEIVLGTSLNDFNKDQLTVNLEYNSIILSSTLSSDKKSEPVNSQYLINTSDQILPLALIEYIMT